MLFYPSFLPQKWGNGGLPPFTGGPSAPPCGPPGGLIKSDPDPAFRVFNAAARLPAARLFHLWRVLQ